MSQSLVSTARRQLIFVGGGITFAGCLVIGVSFFGVTLPDTVQWPGDDSLLVVAFITSIILFISFIININFMVGREHVGAPEPETLPPTPQTGSDLDRIMDKRLPIRHPPAEERQRVRERLRRAVIQTIRRTAGVSRQRAEELVTQGEWTENTTAAAFLGESEFQRPIRLCDLISSRFVFQYSVRQTVRAIVTYATERSEE